MNDLDSPCAGSAYPRAVFAAVEFLLRRVVMCVPYDSAAPVIAIGAQGAKSLVSGNCIYQAAVLGKWLLEAFPTGIVKYFRDDRHHAVLFSIAGGPWFYLDPYLMQLEPAVLPPSPGKVGVRAAPRIGNEFGAISLECARQGNIAITKVLPSSSGPYITHRFRGDVPGAVVDELPPIEDRTIALHPEVTTLSIRVVDSEYRVSSLVYSLVERRDYVLDDTFTRIFPGESRHKVVLSRIAANVGLTSQQLLEYVASAVEAYDAAIGDQSVDYTFPNSINGGERAGPGGSRY